MNKNDMNPSMFANFSSRNKMNNDYADGIKFPTAATASTSDYYKRYIYYENDDERQSGDITTASWPSDGFSTESPLLFLHMNLTNSTGTGLLTTESLTSEIETTAEATVPGTVPGTSLNYLALFLTVIPLLTISGNLLVVLSVIKQRNLRTITNFFISSLAISDAIVAVMVMPFAVYVEVLEGQWALGPTMCDVYIFIDVAASTASIFNLVAICVDRYLAVTYPIDYSQRKNNRRAAVTIFLVWFFSVVIASPIVFGINEFDANEEVCVFTNANFTIASSAGSFFIPCIIMIFLYATVFQKLRQRQIELMAKMRKKEMLMSNRQTLMELDHTQIKSSTDSADQPTTTVPSGEAPQMHLKTFNNNNADTLGKHSSAHCNDSNSFAYLNVPNSSPARVRRQIHKYIPQQQPDSTTPSGDTYSETPVNALTPDMSLVTLNTQPEAEPEVEPEIHSAAVINCSFEPEIELIASQRSFSVPELEEIPFIDMIDPETEAEVFGRSKSQRSRYMSAPCAQIDSFDDIKSLQTANKLRNSLKTKMLNHVGTVVIEEPECIPNENLTKPNEVLAKVCTKKNEILPSLTEGSLRDSMFRWWRWVKETTLRQNQMSPKTLKTYREHRRDRKERKATKTLAIVVVVFLICWVPFFTCHITNAVCAKLNGPCIGFLPFFLTTWIGYMNSFMNPIIYTIFNPDFRKAFRRILKLDSSA